MITIISNVECINFLKSEIQTFESVNVQLLLFFYYFIFHYGVNYLSSFENNQDYWIRPCGDQISDEMQYTRENTQIFFDIYILMGAWKCASENAFSIYYFYLPHYRDYILSMTIYECHVFNMVSDVLISLYMCALFFFWKTERQKQTLSSKFNVYSTFCSCFYDELPIC